MWVFHKFSVEPVLVGQNLDYVVLKEFQGVAGQRAQKAAAQVAGKVAQDEVPVAFDGNFAVGPQAVWREVYAAYRALVYEVVYVPLRTAELCRDFAHRQRRPIGEVERKEGKFELSGIAHRDYFVTLKAFPNSPIA